MGDEPLGDVTHGERRELDALRRRAYGPEADILGDAAALSRLSELEDRVRLERHPVEPERDPAVVRRGAPPPARTARGRLSLIAGTVAAALVVGAVAWSGSRGDPLRPHRRRRPDGR